MAFFLSDVDAYMAVKTFPNQLQVILIPVLSQVIKLNTIIMHALILECPNNAKIMYSTYSGKSVKVS